MIVRVTTNDEDLVALYPCARGEDRILLLRAVGEARGGAGEELLMSEASAQGRGSSDVRSVALEALGRRGGGRATDILVRALADSSVQVQISASLGLAAYGDDTATAAFLSWMEKRLKRKNRLWSWDPREIPAPLLHAIRNEAVDAYATVLQRHLDVLADDEKGWLTRLGLLPGGSPHRPDMDLVKSWLLQHVSYGPVDHQRVHELLERLRRRPFAH